MKKLSIISLASLALVAFLTPACTPNAPSEDKVFVSPDKVADITKDGTVYNLNDFVAIFSPTEEGNFLSDTTPYRTRSYYDGYYFFSIDTLPKDGPGIYIRGRVVTDDYGGNFYKSMVLQQIVDGNQQCLRISVDMGSASGLFHKGQEILIRCNGLAIGRYANQPQLCVPSYNNNLYASSANQKVGWAPGRIPAPRFRDAVTLIGKADESKIMYEEMDLPTLQQKYLKNYEDIAGVRVDDGRLVKITGVHFTGKYDGGTCNRYDPDKDPSKGNPQLDGDSYVFGPTTGNVGYPQSRYVADSSEKYTVLVSCSEYAKYAYFYLPAAKYVGSITGVLGYYVDQPPSDNYPLTEAKWSITPNGIEDILPECQAEGANPQWYPTEWAIGMPQPED